MIADFKGNADWLTPVVVGQCRFIVAVPDLLLLTGLCLIVNQFAAACDLNAAVIGRKNKRGILDVLLTSDRFNCKNDSVSVLRIQLLNTVRLPGFSLLCVNNRLYPDVVQRQRGFIASLFQHIADSIQEKMESNDRNKDDSCRLPQCFSCYAVEIRIEIIVHDSYSVGFAITVR